MQLVVGNSTIALCQKLTQKNISLFTEFENQISLICEWIIQTGFVNRKLFIWFNLQIGHCFFFNELSWIWQGKRQYF